MDAALQNMMDGFLSSYTQRDKSVDFSEWLSSRLQEEIPSLPNTIADNLSGEIIEAVTQYQHALNDVNQAVEMGKAKEEWLAESLAVAYIGMPVNDVGEKLQQMEHDMDAANALIVEDTKGTPNHAPTADSVDWNEYSIKDKAYNIGKHAVVSGLGVAADTIKSNLEHGDGINSGVIEQALQDGLETTAVEVKAVVAGAIRVAVENELTDLLPSDTPTEIICDVAGVAVESAGALLDAATGKTSLTEALDRTARASIAAASRWCASILKGKLLCIPVVGPLAVEFAGGLLDHMNSPQFTENVYKVVRDAAIATWEGIKQAGSGILNNLTNRTMELLHQ